MTLKEKHINLIELSGGTVLKNSYVVKPGIIIIQESKPTNEAETLFHCLNLNTDFFPAAELNSRLTYMSFSNDTNTSEEYLKKIVFEHGHLSIFNDTYITVLLAGVSLESELEFVSHNEAKISRLTSSRTNTQNEPLYVIFNEDEIPFYESFNNLSKPIFSEKNNKDNLEFLNRMNPASKAVSFTISMSLKDWHKTFIGRFSNNGVEKEVQMICSVILSKLRENYSFILNTEEEYYKMNNSFKYFN